MKKKSRTVFCSPRLMALNNVDWEAALHDGCALAERSLNLSLTIDRDIVREIAAEAEKTLTSLQMTSSPMRYILLMQAAIEI